jgi:hypothetical protein
MDVRMEIFRISDEPKPGKGLRLAAVRYLPGGSEPKEQLGEPLGR